MNSTSGTVGCGCAAFVFCLFMGVTAISLGVGAAYPPINRIAAPLVCSGGEMTYKQKVTNPLPGTTYVSASWKCVDRSGRTTPIGTFPLCLYAGTFYGLLLFVLVAPIWFLARLRRGRGATAPPARFGGPPGAPPGGVGTPPGIRRATDSHASTLKSATWVREIFRD